MKTNDVLINSEQAVIGSILIDNNSFDSIDLSADDFFVASHSVMFATMAEMLEKGDSVDVITLAESLDRKSKLQEAGDLKYISEIASNTNTSRNIKQHAKIIKSSAVLRKLKGAATELNDIADGNVDVEEIQQIMEEKIFDLLDKKQKSNVAHVYDAAVESIEFEDCAKNGYKTGLNGLDRLLNGFKKSELTIVAGRPSMGKSTLAMQIGEYVSSAESVVIFSLEMARREVARRFLEYHADRIGKSQALAHFKSLKLHIDDTSAISLSHIRSVCRRIKRQHGLSMIVIDYLQLMQGKGDNRNQEIGSISRGLKAIAKDFDIPVVCLSQLSRKVEERGDKRPIMSDLRESGEIEQDADVILFIYRDEVYNQNTNDLGLAEIICRKNRNGSIGTVYTEFVGELTRFKDTSRKPVESIQKTKSRGFSVV